MVLVSRMPADFSESTVIMSENSKFHAYLGAQDPLE
jgi:hypothetical protein